jgi:hypothetical protein
MNGRSTARRSTTLGIALGCATVATGAASDEPPTSVAQQCLIHADVRRTKILDDSNILFITRKNAIYHNVLPHACPSVTRKSLLNYNISGGRLCAGSLFTVLWQVGLNYTPTFVCPLGMFVPISEDEAADLMALVEEQSSAERRRGKRNLIEAEPVELPPADTAHDSGESSVGEDAP